MGILVDVQLDLVHSKRASDLDYIRKVSHTESARGDSLMLWPEHIFNAKLEEKLTSKLNQITKVTIRMVKELSSLICEM